MSEGLQFSSKKETAYRARRRMREILLRRCGSGMGFEVLTHLTLPHPRPIYPSGTMSQGEREVKAREMIERVREWHGIIQQ